MIHYGLSPEEERSDVVAAAVAITRSLRYVPNHICVTCMRHVYYEQHGDEGHDVYPLTRAERDAVARAHRAASAAEWEAYKHDARNGRRT